MSKRTYAISLDKEQYLSALMNAMKWSEVDRVATGGMVSSEMLLITYEGNDSDLNEDIVVTVPEGREFIELWYSLTFPCGIGIDLTSDPVGEYNKIRDSHTKRHAYNLRDLSATA